MEMQQVQQSLRLGFCRTVSNPTVASRKFHTPSDCAHPAHSGIRLRGKLHPSRSRSDALFCCKTSKTFCWAPTVSLWPLNRGFSSVAGEEIRSLTAVTAERKQLRDAVRNFAEEEIRPVVSKMDEENKVSLDVISALFKQGFMAMEVGTSEGGSGMSVADSLMVIEELSRVDPSVGFLVKIHIIDERHFQLSYSPQNGLVLRALNRHGTEEQKKHYIPKLCSDTVGSFCLSESATGSDAFSLRCSATWDEERKGWMLTGSKQWISNSEEAGLFLVFATVDPEKHEGICCFLVESETEGLAVGSKCEKLGIRASSTCEITLDSVFVPENRLLGSVGEGCALAASLLNESLIDTAAVMLGLAQGAFATTVPYIKEQEQFGQKLIDFQGVRFKVAQLATDIEAARLLVYNAAAMKSAGLPFVKEAAMAKYKASCVAEKVASECIEFFGSRGYTKKYPLEKYYRDAKTGAIYEETMSMQLETIFKALEKEYI